MNTSIFARRGFSLDRLAGFCAVADAGSIVGAARGDVVRQSLLSRQIRELEECFETELVRRHGRGLVLTDAGRHLAALGRSQLHALDDFAAGCRGNRVVISLGASETLLQWLILPRLSALRAACPRADFTVHHVDNDAIAARVNEGTYDFGFLRRKAQRGESGIVELGNFDYVLAAPRALIRGRDLSLTDVLGRLPLALPVSGIVRQAVTAHMKRAGAPIHVVVGCTSYLHSAAALRSGACAAVMPSLAIQELTADRFITWPLTALKITRDPVSIMWNQRNAAIRESIAALAAAAAETFRF